MGTLATSRGTKKWDGGFALHPPPFILSSPLQSHHPKQISSALHPMLRTSRTPKSSLRRSFLSLLCTRSSEALCWEDSQFNYCPAGSFSKSVKLGSVDVSINSAKVHYSSNTMKCKVINKIQILSVSFNCWPYCSKNYNGFCTRHRVFENQPRCSIKMRWLCYCFESTL
jgi:hypothetical protein